MGRGQSDATLARPLAAHEDDYVSDKLAIADDHEGFGRTLVAAGGTYHTVVALAGGAVCSFGDHAHGQLGRRRPDRSNACTVGERVVYAQPAPSPQSALV